MTYTASYSPSLPIPGEPAVLGPITCARAALETNIAVYVPWKNCKLVHAYAVTKVAVASANYEIDLELNAAAGTEIMTITVATSGSAIGTIAEATFSDATAGYDLDRDNADRDAINIEIGGNAGAGTVDIFMYFEPMIKV